MKKNFSFKTLCLVVGLMMGTVSSWAQSSTLLEYGTDEAPWTTESMAEWTVTGSTVGSSTDYFGITGGNGTNYVTKTINPSKNAIVYVDAMWRGSCGLGRYFADGNASYFRFGNIVVAQNDQNKAHGYGFNGLGDLAGVTTFTAGSYRTDITDMPFLRIEIEVNTATNTLTYFAVKSEDGNTTYAEKANLPLENADYTTIEMGFNKSKSAQSNAEQLKWLVVSEEEQTIETASYTVKFVDDEDNELKESITRTGVVGDPITLTDDDKKEFYSGDELNPVKYVYDLDDAASFTIEEGVEVRVLFRKAETWDWTIYANTQILLSEEPVYNEEGEQTGTKPVYEVVYELPIKSGTGFEGDAVKEYYPKAVAHEGVWYESHPSKYYDVELKEDNNEAYVDYIESDRIDEFFEVEDFIVENKRDDGYVADRAANGNSVRVGPNGYLYASRPLNKGIYTMTVSANNSNSSMATLSVELRDQEGNVTDTKLTLERAQTGNYLETVVENIAVPADGMMIQLANHGTYNSNMSIDYMILKKTGDAEFADYTIVFKDNAEGDSIIKTEVVKNVALGEAIQIADSYKESFYNEDHTVKFVYESDDAQGKTVTKEGTTVTINFKYAGNYEYTITAVDEEKDIIAFIGSGSVFQGDTKDVPFSMYVQNDNGKWYYSQQPYVTVNEAQKDTLITFVPTDITYFFECEDMYKTRRAASEDTNNGYSNGKAVGHAGSSIWYTTTMETGGVYNVTVVGKSRRSGTTAIAVGFRTENGDFYSSGDTLRHENLGTEPILLEVEGVTVPAGGSLALNNYNDWNSVSFFDYIVMTKTGDSDYVGVTAPKGVAEATSADSTTGMTFNLRGQRISKPQKGIYIRNGKKLFVR